MDEKIGLKEYGYEAYDYGDSYTHNNIFSYQHGYRANKFSAYTAKNILHDEWTSGICGHTHRAGVHFSTNKSGDYGYWENGCLCDFQLAWEWFKKPNPDWQYAITIISYVEDRFNVHQINIPRKNPFIIYGNKYYTL
jgi:hypothetical protein